MICSSSDSHPKIAQDIEILTCIDVILIQEEWALAREKLFFTVLEGGHVGQDS